MTQVEGERGAGYVTAEELIQESPASPLFLGGRAKAEPKRKPTVAALAAQQDDIMQALAALSTQVQSLAKVRSGAADASPTDSRRSPSSSTGPSSSVGDTGVCFSDGRPVSSSEVRRLVGSASEGNGSQGVASSCSGRGGPRTEIAKFGPSAAPHLQGRCATTNECWMPPLLMELPGFAPSFLSGAGLLLSLGSCFRPGQPMPGSSEFQFASLRGPPGPWRRHLPAADS